MSQKQLFARLAKVDEAKRQVTGIIVSETPDHAREICDYETSKPHFESWSGEIAKASGGKSVGNLRAMHGKVAAGRLLDITFDDMAKTIEVVADVVDDNEWEKVQKGVYNGFSIGGAYGKKWADPMKKGYKRYTAVPTEVSLVDLGCNPDSNFVMVKANGAEEHVPFHVAGQEELLAKIADPDADEETKRDAFQRLAKAYNVNIVAPAEEEQDEEELKKGAYSIGELARLADNVRCFLDYSAVAWNMDGTTSLRSFGPEIKEAAIKLYDALLKLVSEDVEEAKAKLKGLKKQLDEEGEEALSKLREDVDSAGQQLAKFMTALGVEEGTLIESALEKLNKFIADNDELTKSIGTLTSERDTANAELAKLRAEPAPAKGVTTLVVGKEDDGLNKSADSGTKASTKAEETDTLTLMKQAHKNPMQVVGGRFVNQSGG